MREPTPEEVAEYEKRVDRIRMRAEAINNGIDELFFQTNPDTLVSLHHLLHSIAINDEPGERAAFFDGVVTGVLRGVHKVCPGCGEQPHSMAELMQCQTDVTEGEQ